jgi:hypothetical protein
MRVNFSRDPRVQGVDDLQRLAISLRIDRLNVSSTSHRSLSGFLKSRVLLMEDILTYRFRAALNVARQQLVGPGTWFDDRNVVYSNRKRT